MPPLGQSQPEGFQRHNVSEQISLELMTFTPCDQDLTFISISISPQHHTTQQLFATSHCMAHHGLIHSSELTHVLSSAPSLGSFF